MRDKSDENWHVGNKCLENGDLNAAASRIYYSVFQAVLGWARAKKGFSGEKGVHSAMSRLMKEGKRDNIYTRTFTELLGLRVTADYHPETPTVEAIEELLPIGQKIRDHHIKKALQP